jgi:hypothetical protein
MHECEECNDLHLTKNLEKQGIPLAAFPCVHIAYYSQATCDSPTCDNHKNRSNCPDVLIVETGQGYGLPIHDGGSSFVEIAYCPWCGKPLSNGKM